MEIELVIKFRGGEAGNNRIPLYLGSESINGIGRSIILPLHYAITGEVRRRYPFTDEAQIYLTSFRPGSFETIVQIIIDNPAEAAIATAIGTGISANVITDLLKSIWRKTIGQHEQAETEAIRRLERLKSGDLEALTQAVEPGFRRGHAVINHGSRNITIIQGDNSVVRLDQDSKNFLETTIDDDEIYVRGGSIGALNVNDRSGRAFIDGENFGVPFSVHKDSARGTMDTLSDSLRSYAHGTPKYVELRYYRKLSIDGRVKRIIVTAAEHYDE